MTVEPTTVIAPSGVGLMFRVILGSVSIERPKATRMMSAVTVVGLVAAEAVLVPIPAPVSDAARDNKKAQGSAKRKESEDAKRLLYPPPGEGISAESEWNSLTILSSL